MKFDNQTTVEYRVALDTKQNLFIAIDARNQDNIAYGVTINQAIQALQKNV